mmetsp:Transcript_6648/g.5756  ORF Transcript_6648/g.5756 Transcript_6648/m.5756 type:complete len:104 (+) Transcript_6648:335-646(+)
MYIDQPPVWFGDGFDISAEGVEWKGEGVENPNVSYNLNQTQFRNSKFPHGESDQYFLCYHDAMKGHIDEISKSVNLGRIDVDYYELEITATSTLKEVGKFVSE